MSRRQVLADATQAANVRRLQEQEALMRMRAQQQVAAEARERLEDKVQAHAASEESWAAALERGSFDPLAARLWRAHTETALAEVRLGEESVAFETEAVQQRREAWAVQLQLADAVESVRAVASRGVRRADDERRLAAVEDAGHGRRRRS